MNRYDIPPEPPAPGPSFGASFASPFGPVAVVLVAAGAIGWITGLDAASRALSGLVQLHALALAMDLITLVVARRCRRRGGRVLIPYAAPIVFGVLRLVFYGACPQGVAGAPVTEAGPAILIGLLGLVSFSTMVYEGFMIRMALRPSQAKVRPAPMPPADVPVGPEYTYEIQTILQALGHYRGPVDGVLTQEVKGAVKQFQSGSGLAAHGGLTAATVIELRKRWESRQLEGLQGGMGADGNDGRSVWRLIRDRLV